MLRKKIRRDGEGKFRKLTKICMRDGYFDNRRKILCEGEREDEE